MHAAVDLPSRAIQYPLIAKKIETPTILSFSFDTKEHPVSFYSGQWADFYLPHPGQPGKYHVAGFSMISPPSQKDRLEFAVKSSKHPVVRYFHDSLKPSEKVWLDAGHGQFYFRKDMSDSVVLIGGGIGVTPLISIIRYIRSEAPNIRPVFIYSAPSAMELLFHSEMSALDAAGHIAYVPIITRHAGGWLGKKGRIDKALLKERAITGDPDTLYFVCGPAGMVKDVRTMLQELGVSEDKIRVEDWRT